MTTSLTNAHKMQPIADSSLRSCRVRSQSSHCKKSVSNMQRLPEGVNCCRSPEVNRFGSPDPKGNAFHNLHFHILLISRLSSFLLEGVVVCDY